MILCGFNGKSVNARKSNTKAGGEITMKRIRSATAACLIIKRKAWCPFLSDFNETLLIKGGGFYEE